MATEDSVRRRTLAHGYLPDQMPPLFFSTPLSKVESEIDRELPLRPDGDTNRWTEPVRFSSAKPAGLRRRLAIPNPYSYVRIVDVLAAEWTSLMTHWNQSTMSVSRPRLSTEDCGIDDKTSFRKRDERRLVASTRSKFRLRTDIAQCYPSIYTHSLSWALGGKTEAKGQAKNKTFPGALLDQMLREAQDGQTIGLPIGPESSLAAAEIVLCAVDRELQDAEMPTIDAFRSIDDYEIFTTTRSDAEIVLQHLETELAQYELGLNVHKTVIDETPFPIEDEWKSYLVTLAPPASKVGIAHIRAFINQAFALAKRHPSDAVINYALKQADSFKTSQRGHELLVQAALMALQFSPSSVRYAVWSIMNRIEKHEVDKAPLWTCLNERIAASARVDHSYEVTWGLWGLLVSGGRLEHNICQLVAGMKDPCSIAAYMHLRDLGFAGGPEPRILTLLAEQPDVELSDTWILAYEAHHRGWQKIDAVTASPFMDRLEQLRVTFIDDAVGPLTLDEEDEMLDPEDFKVFPGLEYDVPYEY